MSTAQTAARPERLQRSELAVPATSERFFTKAAASATDVIFLDLEDAVSPGKKVEAREAAVAALDRVDWGAKTMAVRVNALDTEWGVRDLIEVVTWAPRLDLVLLPKAGTPADVAFVETLISGIEREQGRDKRIGIEVLIETALGIANVEAIAASSPRLEAMIFGVGDYSIELGTCGEEIGASDPRSAVLGAAGPAGVRPRYLSDQFHFALARMANACRAYGLRAIDGPFANFGDPEGYRVSAERGASLGCQGKWAIHPSQVDLANEIFTPAASRVTWAREILSEIERANRDGAGAFGRNGVLIDMAVEKIARSVIARHDLIANRGARA